MHDEFVNLIPFSGIRTCVMFISPSHLSALYLGADPRELLKEFLPSNAIIPEGLDQLDLWQLLVQLMSEPPKRKKLPEFNTLDDAVKLIRNAKNIIVLTGQYHSY